MSDLLQDVVIVGAGLGGCALALALSERKIPVRLYESRPPNSEVITSGVVLTPNGLRVLDRLGVLSRIESRCYKTTHRVFKNRNDETTGKFLIAGESMYGYANHRVWRSVLLDEMKQMLAERSIQIEYNSRFSGIISDDEDRVDFQINDEACHASLLIGMDGIYSTVRKYLAPDVQPEYTGVMGVLSHIKRDSVAWPHEDYERNATIQDVPGAIFFLPEDPDNIDIMIGLQKRAPEYSREDLEQLQQDKTKLVEFYRERYDEWGPTARSIIDRVTENKDSCFIWPFLRVPTLSSWYSDSGRIVLCGDAAHGLPPSSGQGINQALEDVYSLTLLLTSAGQQSSTNSQANGVNNGNSSKSLEALAFWQDMRQKRIDAVFDWVTNTTNVQRMSDEERRKIIEEGKFKGGAASDNMSWLFTPALEGDVQAWIAAHA